PLGGGSSLNLIPSRGISKILAKMAIGLRESAPQVRFMGRATSRGLLMLCESCASGEDWRDIHIDTQVLNEIAPLAQNRGARKSHHLTIVAGIVDERLHNLD